MDQRDSRVNQPFFVIPPDRVNEALPASARRVDQNEKRSIRACEVGSHLWFIDPDARMQAGDALVLLPSFDAITVLVATLRQSVISCVGADPCGNDLDSFRCCASQPGWHALRAGITDAIGQVDIFPVNAGVVACIQLDGLGDRSPKFQSHSGSLPCM